ncbi:MAG: AraC family transcriptional regulator [Eubacteriales bacterium]|nr:AraC family transcriptional regulator [Eubacteriales bacterium]
MENSITIALPVYSQQDICLNSFGHSITNGGHKYGPAVRSYYLIHYILEGKGEFWVNNIKYSLSKGQGFLIEPDYQTTYISNEHTPWTYIWVGFSGNNASKIVHSLGLSQDTPVFTCDEGEKLKKYVMEMIRHNKLNPADNYRALGMFYLFMGTLANSQHNVGFSINSNTYMQHAISYIQSHITESVSVESVADYVGLNRSYLSVLFKKQTGLSPMKYIQNYRLTKALHMLESSTLSVESIAFSCGYQKAESLTKVFHKYYGMSPTAYRKQVLSRNTATDKNISEDVYENIIGAPSDFVD